MSSARLSLAFIILAALPNHAAACPNPGGDPCAGYDYWASIGPVNAAKIPSDGALVLQGEHPFGLDADWLTTIEITVTKDGAPVPGELTATTQQGVLLWQPTDGWTPGATYQMSGQLINVEQDAMQCGEPTIPFAADLTIDTVAGAAIGPTVVTGEVLQLSYAELSLDNLACCAGATPSLEYAGCSGDQVVFDPAVCAPLSERRYLTVNVTGEPAAPGPAGAQIGYTFVVDGQYRGQSLIPSFSEYTETGFCAVIEAEDLVTGEVTVSAEQCFGQDLAGELGSQPLDPTEVLDCPLQQCATVNMAWDLTMCTPYGEGPGTDTNADDTGDTNVTSPTEDPGDTDGSGSSGDTDTAGESDSKGCSVAHDRRGGLGLLALASLLALARRRRAAA